jgi:hypothetical protein
MANAMGKGRERVICRFFFPNIKQRIYIRIQLNRQSEGPL